MKCPKSEEKDGFGVVYVGGALPFPGMCRFKVVVPLFDMVMPLDAIHKSMLKMAILCLYEIYGSLGGGVGGRQKVERQVGNCPKGWEPLV